METLHEEGYMVFVRPELGPPELPQPVEQPLAFCGSYEEACEVRRDYQTRARECIIRYIGHAGGGD